MHYVRQHLLIIFLLTGFLLMLWAIPAAPQELSKRSFAYIGSGTITGVYFPVAGAICERVNTNIRSHGIRCAAEPSPGSIANITTLKRGKIQAAIVQSDIAYDARHGIGHFDDEEPWVNMRSLFAIFPEAVTIVVRTDAAAATVDDLKPLRFNVGAPGTGVRFTWSRLWPLLTDKESDFTNLTHYQSGSIRNLICSDQIDAFLFVAGHPSALMSQTLSSCSVSILSLDNKVVESAIKKFRYYQKTPIPKKMYADQYETIQTFGLYATLITTSKLPEETAYQITKAVLGKLDKFTRSHPALRRMTLESATNEKILFAPLHKGAIRAIKEIKGEN